MSNDNIARAEIWTENRVSDLKIMWLSGQSASQIARKLGGVSRNAVIGKVHRMGLAGRDRPAAPRAVGRTSRHRITAVQSNSIVRRAPARAPAAPQPICLPGGELAATATIHTLADHDCRWPIGDPRDTSFGYCGRARGQHASYCDHHGGVALHKRSSRRAVAITGLQAPAMSLS
jgi:GcrA cell cycle regulator